MAHIALFAPSLRGGGAERVMVNIARSFSSRGHRVDLVLAKAAGPYMEDVPTGVRIVDLASARILHSLFPLMRYLRRERPEVMMATMSHANIVAIWATRLSGIDCRVVVREANVLGRGAQSASGSRRLTELLMRKYYPKADLVIANSQRTAKDLSGIVGLPHEKLQMIYNPVVTPELMALAEEPIDHDWYVDGAPPVVLGVGRLAEQKDFPTLIRAFAIVRETTEARLMILGEGEDRENLEKLIGDLGLNHAVSVPGFVSNPYKYMKRASLFVLSSKWEGFGNVLVEAMAVGTPVVSTDAFGGPREILDNGTWGRIVPVGKAKVLAEAMLQSLRSEDSQPALNRAMDFRSDVIARQYEEALGVQCE